MKKLTAKTNLEQKIAEIDLEINQLNVVIKKKEKENEVYTSQVIFEGQKCGNFLRRIFKNS